jgi:hypothetical protein
MNRSTALRLDAKAMRSNSFGVGCSINVEAISLACI